MKRICFFTAGVLPVPPVRGGAVENLIKFVLDENEKSHDADLFVTSIHDEAASVESRRYSHCEFCFVKIPAPVSFLDGCVYFLMRVFLRKRAMSFRMVLARLWYIAKSKRYFLRNDFDCIVAENHASLFMVMKDRRMARKYDGKFFYHAHNEPNGNFGCKRQIERCARILTVSNFISESYKRSYPAGRAEYVFVPNGIDTAAFMQELPPEEKKALQEKLGISEDDFVIIFAGRLVEGKGILQLSRVFARLPFENRKLLVVGAAFFGSNERSPIQKQLEAILGACMEKVVFTGYVPYGEIWKYYKISSCAGFVPIWNEACALTNIEAQASSLPVVTTISGGIPEYSSPDSRILLPINEDLERNLYEKLLWLHENSEHRAELGRKNAEYAGRFSVANFYRNFMAAIDIGEKAGGDFL